MDAFIQKHRPLVFSTLYMLFALLASGYSVYYSRIVAYQSDVIVATATVQAANHRIEEKNKTLTKKDKEVDIGIRYLPTFLARINEISHNNEVVIRTLTPNKSGTLLKFDLSFVSDYATFVRFTAELESLDILLDDIQVHPYNTGRTPPLHSISFSLIPQNNAEPIAGKRLDDLKKWVFAKDKRDPFQRYAYDVSRKIVNAAIDLTWIYKLEGLGVTDGKPFANINRRKYQVGDDLDGRTIIEIDKERVQLEKQTRDGVTKYMLTFRKAMKNTPEKAKPAP